MHIFFSSTSANVALKTGKIVNNGLWVFVKDYTSFCESAEGQAKSKRDVKLWLCNIDGAGTYKSLNPKSL